MNALLMLLKNLASGIATVRFPEPVATPPAFRGLVEINGALCQGCAMCAFVCTGKCITFRSNPTSYDWSYEPGRCTFCGRCVDACASHALSQSPSRPPVYTQSGALNRSHNLPRKPPPGDPKGGTP